MYYNKLIFWNYNVRITKSENDVFFFSMMNARNCYYIAVDILWLYCDGTVSAT